MPRRHKESRPQLRPQSPTFHRFPSLPPELRLRIWHFAIQHTPVMVTLEMGLKGDPLSKTRTRWRYLYVDRPIPRPLLSVNWEARSAALSAYLPGFYDRSGSSIVWINPKLDTLFVDGWLVELLAQYGVVKWIERVAFPVEDWLMLINSRSPPIDRRVKVLCEEMPKLREVQLITWDDKKWSGAQRWLPLGPWWSKWEEADEGVKAEFARSFIKCCSPTVGYFRRNLERVRELRGIAMAQNKIVVKAISLGTDRRWDHELRFL